MARVLIALCNMLVKLETSIWKGEVVNFILAVCISLENYRRYEASGKYLWVDLYLADVAAWRDFRRSSMK